MKESKKNSNVKSLIYKVLVVICVAIWLLAVILLIQNKNVIFRTKIKQAPTFMIEIPTNAPSPNSTSIPVQQKIIPTNVPVKQNLETTIGEGDLINAINAFRSANGLSQLSANQSLCQETRKRVQDMVSINSGRDPANYTLSHDGMAQDIQNGTLARLVGKQSYGENVASAYCRNATTGESIDVSTATQLVEWCFANSPTHRSTLMRPDWTDVCSSGQFPFYVQTFAK